MGGSSRRMIFTRELVVYTNFKAKTYILMRVTNS
jgi:hypothetical protein